VRGDKKFSDRGIDRDIRVAGSIAVANCTDNVDAVSFHIAELFTPYTETLPDPPCLEKSGIVTTIKSEAVMGTEASS
jgi:hypothetical protein